MDNEKVRQIKEIRDDLLYSLYSEELGESDEGYFSMRDLAIMFNLSVGAVHKIIKKRSKEGSLNSKVG